MPLFIVESAPIAAPSRVELMRQAGLEAQRRLGSPLLFEMVTWLQANAAAVVSKPIPSPSTTAARANAAKPAATPGAVATTSPAPSARNARSAERRPVDVAALSRALKAEQEAKAADAAWQRFQKARERLPTVQHGDVLRAVVAAKSVVVISGATGCGKSTQLPQLLLDAEIAAGRGGACSVICTQPRRMAAIGVAQRVAQERCERLGDVVGYSVRLDSRSSARTRLLYCTTGILLRRFISDAHLTGVSHVIVDEVHERSLEIDFLLLLLRRLLAGPRPDLKIVLMSASLDAAQFATYFGKAPVFEIPGSLYAPILLHRAVFSIIVRLSYLRLGSR